ncbi:MAG TPA: pyridoxal phosphate-dependent aminotransferase, partial [Aliiroseovarius sp.]|nr:pyridoxal phosphate-dependent aminotransferase [Aliiroseovarius sp.]
AKPVPVQARAEDQFQPDITALDAAAEGAKSLLINTPNNPTGVVYSRETLAGISEVIQGRDMWLISDEVYDTQIWDGAHTSPRALPEMAGRTLVIGSMSKSHAMTGSRIGWVIGPDEVIGHMINLATSTTYGVAGFVQMAALFALDQGDALETRVAAPFRRRRDAALRLIAAQNVVQIVPAQGAMYLMLDIRATGMSGEDFAFALLEQEKIAVMPGESFGQAAAGHVRVAMTVEDTRFNAALERVIGFARSLAAKST